MARLQILIHSEVVHGREQGLARSPSARKRPSNCKFGEWLSLVEHLVRDQGLGGSNPLSPTMSLKNE